MWQILKVPRLKHSVTKLWCGLILNLFEVQSQQEVWSLAWISQTINITLNSGIIKQMKTTSMVCKKYSSHNWVCYESFFPFVCWSNLWSKLTTAFFASLPTVLKVQPVPMVGIGKRGKGKEKEKKKKDDQKKEELAKGNSLFLLSAPIQNSRDYFFSPVQSMLFF